MGKWWTVAALGIVAVFWSVFSGGTVRQESAPVFSQTTGTTLEETQVSQSVELPYVFRECGLILQQLSVYEGPFPLGTNDNPLAKVAALMIYNPGKQAVAYAEVTLKQESQNLQFIITYLPPGSQILVLEETGKNLKGQYFFDCRCDLFATWEVAQVQVEIDEGPEGLVITNPGQKQIKGLTLYYKQYVPQGNFYLGGQTRQFKVENLTPGEVRLIVPEGYAPMYSKTVGVILEE